MLFISLNRGLKEHVIKILASLLEADPEQGMKFDDLFQAVEQIKAMKVLYEEVYRRLRHPKIKL